MILEAGTGENSFHMVKAHYEPDTVLRSLHGYLSPSSKQPHEVGMNIFPILQVRKVSHREGKSLAQSHAAKLGFEWNWLSVPASKTTALCLP